MVKMIKNGPIKRKSCNGEQVPRDPKFMLLLLFLPFWWATCLLPLQRIRGTESIFGVKIGQNDHLRWKKLK